MENTTFNKKKFWSALIIFSLIGQVAWVVENMYFNVFIYNMFAATPTQISLMVGASSVIATITTIFMGALSDKLRKRKLFISIGYILWGISILGFSLISKDGFYKLFPTATSITALCITVTIILDCIMTFFGSTANDACFNAWLTDAVDNSKRGKVEGVNSMMPLMAILVVFGGFMSFDLSLASSWKTIFIVIGVVVVLCGILGAFIIDEPVSEKSNDGYLKNILYSFRPSTVKQNPLLYLTTLAFAIFCISIQVFMPYLIIYYEVALKLSNYVLIMAPAIIIAGAITAIYGRYYDKVGFVRGVIPTIACLILGYILLAIFTNVVLVFIGSLLMMTGYLTGMAVFGAMIRDNTPVNLAGSFQGLRIIGQVLIPGIIGPAIGALVLADAEVMVGSDGTESFIPNNKIFIAALIVAILAVIAVYLIHLYIKRKKIAKE